MERFIGILLDKDYRDIVEIVDLMEPIQSKLEINKVPHFTMPLNRRFNGSSRFLIWNTLHKFVTRLNSVPRNQIFQKTLNLIYSWCEIMPVTAIDSNGFTSGHCSYYYSWRTGKRRRSFVKTGISVDVTKFIITGYKGFVEILDQTKSK